MRKTLANLEREEKAVIKAYNDGQVCAHSAREHAYNIKRHGLYEAAGYDSWNHYTKAGRMLGVHHDHAGRLAICGEVEGYIPKNAHVHFSDRALTALSSVRVVKDGKKTHDLDIPKLKRVIDAVVKRADNGETITEKLCREVIAEKSKPKKKKRETAPSLEEQLEAIQLRLSEELRSFKELHDLQPEAFSDANESSPGCVKRLAAGYAEIASFLRRVIK